MLAYDRSARDGEGVTAILLHPHPDMGGNRHHPIVDALYRGLPVTTLRFDFSSSVAGIARSEVGEAIDLAPEGSVVLMGYSFGADIALTVTDPRVIGWFLVAPPLRIVEPADMTAASDPRPKCLIVPEHDQFCPPERAIELTSDWASASVATVPGGDHFLAGRTAAVLDAAVRWLPTAIPAA